MTSYKSNFDMSLKPHCFKPKYWGNWLSLGLLFLFSYCPVRIRDRFATWVANRIYNAKFLNKRKKIAFTNLSLCFPEYSEQQKEQLMRDNIIALAQITLSLGELKFRSRQYLLNRVNLIGEHHLQEVERQGKGALFLSPHSYGLDYASIAGINARGYPLSGMFNDFKNPVYDWFVSEYRTRFTFITGKGALYHRSEGLKPAIKSLRDKTHFFYLPDEDHGRKKSIFTPFYATQKATLPMIGRLAKLGKGVILPIYSTYNSKTAKFDIILHEPLYNISNKDDLQDSLLVNQAIERLIDEDRSQYMWSLKLLKTRPEVGLNIYK